MATQITKHFTLEDFTKTSIKGVNNTPDSVQLQNIRRLADMLEEIFNKVGPFTITSGFRSKELNSKLAGENAQVSSTSFHMTGEAADITPVGIKGARIFMADIIRAKIPYGELYVKTNTIHISLPTSTKRNVAGEVVNDKYYKFSTEQLADFLAKNKGAIAGVGIIVALGALAFFLSKGNIT